MYKRILLTDDGSELARKAIPHAAQLASAPGAAVLVLRVSHASGEDRRSLTEDSWPALVQHGSAREQIEADPPLSEVTAQLTEAGVDAAGSLLLKDDDAGEAIVDASARLGCDVIVMSTHGITGVRRAVLGSVADHVVRNTSVPVLLCR
jgi:nucleotide-binding universal stress UspA family protein